MSNHGNLDKNQLTVICMFYALVLCGAIYSDSYVLIYVKVLLISLFYSASLSRLLFVVCC